MKEPLNYIIESIICSGLFFALHQLFIMRYTGFKVNRVFLLIGISLSCIIPMFSIPVWDGDTMIIPIVETVAISDNVTLAVGADDVPKHDIITWLIYFIYLLGVTLLLLSHVIRFYRRGIVKKNNAVKNGNYRIVEDDNIKTPFSFLRTIYIPVISEDSEKQLIISHEYSHVKHYHSYERIFLEFHKLIFWFNPFVWFSMRKLVEIQEMEADADVIDNGADVTEYRMTLLKQVFGVKGEFACNLLGHPLKKRFLAMTMKRAEQNARVLLSIPFFAVAIVIFAFTKKPVEINFENTTSVDSVAQEKLTECVVFGTVIDFETGIPIAGAILVNSNKKGIVSGADGKYSFKAVEGSVYEVLYPDYEKGIIIVGDKYKQEIDVRLKKTSIIENKKKGNQEKKRDKESALIIVAGKVCDSLDDVPANRIKSMKVIKNVDKLSLYIEKYGDAARNGVIEIELKE